MGNNFSKLKREKAYELTNREIENDHLNFIRRHALSENEISYRLLLENNLIDEIRPLREREEE